jgi:hypothetical protein
MLVSGSWSGLLILYLMIDHPKFTRTEAFDVRYGIFLAMAGAVLIFLGGLRERGAKPARRRARRAEGADRSG